MALEIGLTADVHIIVARQDTAEAVGSGDVPVLATPRLLAVAEAATVAAVAPHLEPGFITVGVKVAVEHLLPSPVGAGVRVRAQLTGVDDRHLTFAFAARHVAPDIAIDGAAIDGAAGGVVESAGAEGFGPDSEAGELVGTGTVERILVRRDRFIERSRRT